MSDTAEWGSDPDTVIGPVAVILQRGLSGSKPPIQVMLDVDATVGQLKNKLRRTGQLTASEYADCVARGKIALQGGEPRCWSLRDGKDDYSRFMATRAVQEQYETRGRVEFTLVLTPHHGHRRCFIARDRFIVRDRRCERRSRSA